MRVFSCLQGVRAKETAPGCLHPPAWGPLLGHLPASPAPGWPAARVPVGPGTPPSPREAAARGEGCARLSWPAPRAASAPRHQQDGKDVPWSSPGAGHRRAAAHGSSRRKSGATVLQLACGKKERKVTSACARRRPPGFACPGLPAPRSPALEFQRGQRPPTPRGLALLRAPVGHPLRSAFPRTNRAQRSYKAHLHPSPRPCCRELSAGSTVSRDTFLECTGRGPGGQRGTLANPPKQTATFAGSSAPTPPDGTRGATLTPRENQRLLSKEM